MSTNTNQIKVTLSDPLYDFLNSKAGKFGLTLSSYIKNLIINDVKDMDYPTYQASSRTEQAYKKALEEKDSAIEINNIDQFFEGL